jgi:hypothetical protein
MNVAADTRVDDRRGRVPREAVARAWLSLLDRADGIADHITAEILERSQEWFDGAGPQMRAEVRISTREHVRTGLGSLAGIAGRSQDAINLWRETGRRRARQGMPLEMMLAAYTLGSRVLWQAMQAQQADHDRRVEDDVLVAAGRQIWSALDTQSATMTEAYRRESALMQRRDLQRQGRVLDALVEGRGSDPAFAGETRETLGVEIDEPIACVVALFDDTLDNPLRNPDDQLQSAEITSYWHVRGDTYLGLVRLGHRRPDELVKVLEPIAQGRVGIAAAPEGLAGFSTAYQLAVGTAETIPRETRRVVWVEDRLPEVLLATNPAVSSMLVRTALGPVLALPARQSEVLVKTLRALIDHNGSPTHAAEELYCHRNTVIYRMRQLTELTGRDLTDARDRLLCDLALLALET